MTDNLRNFDFDKEVKKGSVEIRTDIIPDNVQIEIYNCEEKVSNFHNYQSFQYQFPKKFLNEFLRYPFDKHKIKFHSKDFIISISKEQNYYDYNQHKQVNKYNDVIEKIKENIKDINITSFNEDDIKDIINKTLLEKEEQTKNILSKKDKEIQELKEALAKKEKEQEKHKETNKGGKKEKEKEPEQEQF